MSFIVVLLLNGAQLGKCERPSDMVVQIGVLSPLSGSLAFMGKDALNGAKLASEMIAGANQARVELVIDDSAYDSMKAVSAYRRMGAEGVRVFLVVGSPMALALRPLTESSGHLLFAALAAQPNILAGTSTMLRHSGRMDDQARMLAEILRSRNETTRIAVISVAAEWTSAFTGELRRLLKDNQAIALSMAEHLPGESDFRPYITGLLKDNPNVFVVNSYGASAGNLIRQIRELGFQGPLYASSGLAISPDGLDVLKQSRVRGVGYFTVADPLASFSEIYRQKFGVQASFFAFQAFQDVELLSNAAAQAKASSREMAEYLKHQGHFTGRFGRMTIGIDGDIVEPIVLKSIA